MHAADFLKKNMGNSDFQHTFILNIFAAATKVCSNFQVIFEIEKAF